jgi:phosphosulfolactate synthase
MEKLSAPGFIDLPPRTSKPRSRGLTHVLDKGLTLPDASAHVEAAAPYIDIWKLGWGTAYLDPAVSEKVNLLATHAILACVGGTLLEIAWAQGKAAECLAWAADAGFPAVEVSNGVVGMPPLEKRRLIAAAAERFTVLAEVGDKDPHAPVSPARWSHEMLSDLEAGATWVIAEGRESGTVGLYGPDGAVREPLFEALVDAVGVASLIFEAPRKDQQAWFIRTLGSNVSLGNVVPADILGLEALRLGLRADTAMLNLADLDSAASAP